MLTREKYEQLWAKYWSHLEAQGVTMPPYSGYKKREDAKEDYLTKFNSEKLIKYILLGEAAPGAGNYIYIDKSGSYITAPLNACGTDTDGNRIDAYYSNGFHLLDLYVYSLKYSKKVDGVSIRELFASNKEFMDEMLEQVKYEISSLENLSDDWDFCFVAPLKTSSALLEHLKSCHSGEFMAGRTVTHEKDQLDAPSYTDSLGRLHPSYTKNEDGHVSKNARIAVAIGGTGPSTKLLKRALSIPGSPSNKTSNA